MASRKGIATRWLRHDTGVVVVLAALVLGAPLASLREGAPQKAPVYVTASLLDRNNLFIEDLSQDEVVILENGQGRAIEFMAKDEIPAVYGIVFERALMPERVDDDRSPYGRGSGATAARNIAHELIDKYLGRQTVWVGVYDRELQVVLDGAVDGFQAKEAIQQLRGLRRPTESFLYGALLAGTTKMSDRSERRRVLLLFMEILDAESAAKIKALKNLLAASNMELFAVSFASRHPGSRAALHPQMSQSALRELAQATAGEAFFSADYREHIEDLTRRLYNHLRTLYTFGFSAESTAERPGTLEIKCTRPGSRVRHHLTVPVLR